MNALEVPCSACNKASSFGIRRALADDRYSHVDVKMKDGRLIGANVVPGVDINGHEVRSGLAIREMNYEKFVRSNVVRFTALDGDKVIDFLIEAMKDPDLQPFDWSAIWNFGTRVFFGRKWLKTRGLFCAEAVVYAGRMTGEHVVSPELDKEVITPRDLRTGAPPLVMWKRENEVLRPEYAGLWCSAAPWADDEE